MTLPTISSEALRRADQILTTMSSGPVAAPDLEEPYKLLSGNMSLADTQVLRMINSMEIEEFFPARLAILLKLNWNDIDFSKSILSGFIQDLRDRGVNGRQISVRYATHLLDILGIRPDGSTSAISTSELEDVLSYLHAFMRFAPGQDVYTEDDFISLSKPRLLEFISNKEDLHSRLYLAGKLRGLSDRYTNARGMLTDLLDRIHKNDFNGFKAGYLQFLDTITVGLEENIRGFIFEELKSAVEEIEPKDVFRSLYRILKTHEFYGKQLTRVVDLTRSLQDAEPQERNEALFARCQNVYQHNLKLLADYKNMSRGSMTMYSLQYGLIRKEWNKINTLFQSRRHALCDCHAKPEDQRESLWPLNQSPFAPVPAPVPRDPEADLPRDLGENVAVFGCNWGSGHKMAAKSASEIVREHGYHPVTIDIPADMLSNTPQEEVQAGETKPDLKQQVFNTLLVKKHFALINALRSVSGCNKEVPLDREQVRKTLQRLLLINPSHAITTIASQSEPLFKACEVMGIPCINLATDVDRSVYVRRQPLDYAHYRVGIPYPEEDMVPQVSPAERPEQIVVSGPPTNPVFNQEYSQDEIAAFRRELEVDRGLTIPANKRLIVVSNGSNGTYSTVPKLLVDYCRGKTADEIDFVVVVLCGKSQEYQDYIRGISSVLPSGVMQSAGFMQQADMNKLYRIASYGGGVIGKSGGLTVFELSKCGTRLLVDNIAPMSIPKSTNPRWKSDIKSGDLIRIARGILTGFITFLGYLIGGIGTLIKNGSLGLLNFLSRFPGMQKNYLAWEVENQNFAIKKGFAQTVDNASDFKRKFEDFLLKSKLEPVRVDTENFSERLPLIMEELSRNVSQDATMNFRRQFVQTPEAAANLLFNQDGGR